jgi:uncharacterized protein
MKSHSPNRLIHEKSPYLLQHAYNPVDWYPWGEEAFGRARAEHKPIFLSIGYSTCHWCHVMERESFENEQIAAILNAKFVSIKVDREERPDVDRVYMSALQAMGQGGGWPMSMFLTSDLEPFYGGTYFPPVSRFGRAGFPDVLEGIHQIWVNEHDKVHDAATRIHDHLHDIAKSRHEGTVVPTTVADECFKRLSEIYDSDLGGFGGAPKFPRPSVFSFLLRYHHATGNVDAREMTVQTLRKMALGGIYDQLGGGFHRYSVDAEWRVPHFEKMLYDQAQLVCSYLDAFRVSRDPLFARIAHETLDYVRREMMGREGGFCSAEDADSARPDEPEEEGEGAYYVWTKKEILSLLHEDGLLFCHQYGVEDDGNATVDPQHEFTGRNILHRAHTPTKTARAFKLPIAESERRLARAHERLLATRNTRPRPQRDDKVLASWNGLMISAFTRGCQVFDNRDYLAIAEAAADFILQTMYDPHRDVLLHRYRDGESRFDGHLDDYAFFVQALIDLYETTGERQRLTDAVRLTHRQVQLFSDDIGGGFFETTGDDRSVMVRMKEQYDGAEPSGNSVAVSNLVRLARHTDQSEWEIMARKTVEAFSSPLSMHPSIMPNMVASALALEDPPRQIVFAGNPHDGSLRLLQEEVFARYLPDFALMYNQQGVRAPTEVTTTSRLSEMKMIDGRPTAYLCEDFACRLPTTDPEELSRQLG